jgi:hypothetical protein
LLEFNVKLIILQGILGKGIHSERKTLLQIARGTENRARDRTKNEKATYF